jgi:hypothetical protein
MKKPNKSKAALPVRDPLKDAKFSYWSVCCNEVAKKTPCVAASRNIQPHLGAHPEAEGTLGSWRCGTCGKSCKCTRNVRKQEETSVSTT